MHYIASYYSDRTACNKLWAEVDYAISVVQLRVTCPECMAQISNRSAVALLNAV